MPFTLSHAAAALPFRHTRLVISAVVVGCMAPDFAYFLEFGSHNGFGHTLPGLFLLDLPLGLLVLWLFHRYAKQPLSALLPERARQRLQLGPRSISMHSFSRLAVISLSILVGAITHIFWDSCTHTRSWIALHWSFLQRIAVVPVFGPRSYADIFQYLSSAFGIVVILLWGIHWYRNSTPLHSQPNHRYVTTDRIVMAAAFVIAVIVALLRAAAAGLPEGVHGGQRFLTDAAVTGIPLFWCEVVLYGLIRARRRVPVQVA